jgi:hypothetical protein
VPGDLSRQPGYLTWMLDRPAVVDPGTEVSQLLFRFFHFDPSFARPAKPPGVPRARYARRKPTDKAMYLPATAR